MTKIKFTPKMLTVMGVLIALEIVIAGILFGPVPAMLISILADVLAAFLFPVGPFFPGLTVTAALTGLLYGALLHKNQSMPRIAAAVGVHQWVLSLLLNSFWLSILYGWPYLPTLVGRLAQCGIMTAAELIFIPLTVRTLRAVGRQARL